MNFLAAIQQPPSLKHVESVRVKRSDGSEYIEKRHADGSIERVETSERHDMIQVGNVDAKEMVSKRSFHSLAYFLCQYLFAKI